MLQLVSPKILDFNQKNKFEYAGAAGGFLDFMGFPYCRGRVFDTLEEDLGQYDQNQTIGLGYRSMYVCTNY